MIQMDVWHIEGKDFHFGRHGLGIEETSIHFTSDALFSALLCCLKDIKGDDSVQQWMDLFLGNCPPFVITSAFPRAGEIRFYPKPMSVLKPAPIRNLSNKSEDKLEGKKIKRLRYISEKIFLELLDGYPLSVLASKGETIQNGEVLVHSDEVSLLPKDIRDNRMPIWLVNRRPRVSVDRVNSASEIYYSGQTVFSPDCGLWFAVRWYDYSEVLTSTFEEALLFLGDAGIGGERSSGMGKAFFKKQNTKADLSYSTNTEWVALSRYIPAVDECTVLNNQQAFYSLEKVGGWISSGTERGQRRICLRMLSEGSVFGPIEKAVLGSILNVAPVFLDNQKREVRPLTYPVWRSGLAFPVSFKRELR